MSSTVTYYVDGMKIEKDIFNRLELTNADKETISKLEDMSDDEMTVAQLKQLKSLKANEKTIVFNGCMLTTKSEGDEPEACCYYDARAGTVYIPGHEGSGLTLSLNNNKTLFVPKNGYFTDNYDNHVSLVQQVIKSFRCSCTLRITGTESGEMPEPDEKILWTYIYGVDAPNEGAITS